MLSAILSKPLTGYNVTPLEGFGVATLEGQSEHERTYSPLPQPGGHLVHDPDFALPTTAGMLPWRLFHYSALPDTEGPFGNGRRASWPQHLCADTTGTHATGYIVTVTLEREDGGSVQYIGNSPANSGLPATFTAYSPRLFDTLKNAATTDVWQAWDETRFDTGTVFHYPAAALGDGLFGLSPDGCNAIVG